MKEEILNEITEFCNECNSKEDCSEEDCVLYRIEKKITKRKYKVEVQETLSRIVEVEAENEFVALGIVEDKYKDEEIVLNAEDYVDTNIKLFRG